MQAQKMKHQLTFQIQSLPRNLDNLLFSLHLLNQWMVRHSSMETLLFNLHKQYMSLVMAMKRNRMGKRGKETFPLLCSSSSLLVQVVTCKHGFNSKRIVLIAQVGWIYGSVTEDILTGFKMHCHGWRSIYCTPRRPGFKVSTPRNLSNGLQQAFQWALGSIEIFMSKHCPLWYGYGGLKWLQHISYINSIVYPWTSIPLVVYCTLPAICLLTGKFIIPEV